MQHSEKFGWIGKEILPLLSYTFFEINNSICVELTVTEINFFLARTASTDFISQLRHLSA